MQYPEQESRVKMSSKRNRSSRSSALNSNTKPTTYSSKDAAFEQELIGNGIYPYNRGQKPNNWEEIQERSAQPRPSLSPSQFSDGAFEEFQLKNDEATTEAEVMSEVFPMITGKTKIPSGLQSGVQQPYATWPPYLKPTARLLQWLSPGGDPSQSA